MTGAFFVVAAEAEGVIEVYPALFSTEVRSFESQRFSVRDGWIEEGMICIACIGEGGDGVRQPRGICCCGIEGAHEIGEAREICSVDVVSRHPAAVMPNCRRCGRTDWCIYQSEAIAHDSIGKWAEELEPALGGEIGESGTVAQPGITTGKGLMARGLSPTIVKCVSRPGCYVRIEERARVVGCRFNTCVQHVRGDADTTGSVAGLQHEEKEKRARGEGAAENQHEEKSTAPWVQNRFHTRTVRACRERT